MEIRGFTVFADPDADRDAIAELLQAAPAALPLPVQVSRLALPPFPDWLPADPEAAAALLDRELGAWQAAGFGFIALGPVLLRHDPGWITRLPGLLAHPAQPFAGVEIADLDGAIEPARCWRLGEAVRAVADASDDGFAGMYLTALAGCPAGSPFFPAAYHGGGAPRFALAMQAADLAVDVLAACDGPLAAQQRLTDAVTRAGRELAEACERLAARCGVAFAGIDFSLAPYPGQAASIAAALESLTGAGMGDSGTVFGTGLLAAAVQAADFPRCGFSGVMLPVLEDTLLGERSRQGRLAVNDLLVASSVCGTGLDTIPLPGDVGAGQLAAIYLDVAMLASRIGKPLTARLMPIPGAIPGDAVAFGSEYFAAGAVLPVPGNGMREPPAAGRLRIPRLGL